MAVIPNPNGTIDEMNAWFDSRGMSRPRMAAPPPPRGSSFFGRDYGPIVPILSPPGPKFVPPGPDDAARRALAAQQAAVEARAEAERLAAIQKMRDTGTVFSRFDLAEDVVENQKVFLTTGLFSNTTNGKSINAATMSVLFTSSLQHIPSKQYYYETWNKDPASAADAEPQFSIAYGHR